MPVAAHYLLESVGPDQRRLICVVPSLSLAQRIGECHAGVALAFVESLPGHWEAAGPAQTYCLHLYPVELREAESGTVPVFLEASRIETTGR